MIGRPLLPPRCVSGSLLVGRGHLHQAVLVEAVQPPALLLRQVLSPASFVKLDRGLVVLGHHEHHAAAARLHRQLQ